jgi:hypothetical protein
MARLMGTEHMMMGDQGGNRALSEDKSRNIYLIANSVLHYVRTQAQHDVVEPLWMLNGFDEDKKPTFESEDVTFKNVDQIAGTLQKMAAAGATLSPDDEVVNDVRDLLGVSRSAPVRLDLMTDLLGDEETEEDPVEEGLEETGEVENVDSVPTQKLKRVRPTAKVKAKKPRRRRRQGRWSLMGPSAGNVEGLVSMRGKGKKS